MKITLSNLYTWTKSAIDNSLEVDCTGFSLEDLALLLHKIGDEPISSLHLSGLSSIAESDCAKFLDNLLKVEKLSVEGNPALQQLATQISSRNHYLSITGIKPQTNVWRAIIEDWASRQPYDHLRARQPLLYYPEESKAILEMGDLFFDRMLEQLEHIQQRSIELIFNHRMSDIQLEKLAQYIKFNHDSLPFSRLTLYVDKTMLQRPAYLALLQSLQQTSLQGLSLLFPTEALKTAGTEIASYLENKVADLVHYPVVIGEQLSQTPVKNRQFDTFIAKVIANVQQHNQARRWHRPSPQIQKQSKQTIELDQATPFIFDKKIKLKELIKNKETSPGAYDDFIKLEVQHTEVEQQQQTQMAEEVVNINVAAQETEQAIYDGELIDFERFKNPPYSNFAPKKLYEEVGKELFGNMPQAISFLSHEAAMKIAENGTAFATFNIDNLPQNFILKKTHKGQMVLDYDQNASERLTNAFTPKERILCDLSEPIYDIPLPINIKEKTKILNLGEETKKLVNLWIRYGEMGVDYLLNTLQELDEKHKDLSAFIIDNYMKSFSHWDYFIDDHSFIDALDRIKQYDAEKLKCFTQFLENHENYPFEMHDLVNGFDAFWKKWVTLAKKNQIEPKAIIGQWSQAKVGNPIVFMERLITILSNARDLNEQLACFKSFDPKDPAKLSLRNYEAYHASKEGFKIVAPDMKLHYDPNVQNDKTFNPDEPLYRETWASLIEASQDVLQKNQQYLDAKEALQTMKNKEAKADKEAKKAQKPRDEKEVKKAKEAQINQETEIDKLAFESQEAMAQFYPRAYRIIGQQLKAVRIDDFILGLQAFLNENKTQQRIPTAVVMNALFFVAHERYKGDIGIHELLNSLVEGGLNARLDKNATFDDCLLKLFNQGIHLNEREGIVLRQSINLLHSTQVDTDKYTKRLFDSLQNYNYATLNYLRYLANDCIFKTDRRIGNITANSGTFARPVVYALDTAAYLMQSQEIDAFYRADLLLFSELINEKGNVIYQYVGKNMGGGSLGNKASLAKTNYYEGLTRDEVGCGLLKLSLEHPDLIEGKVEILYSPPTKANQESTEGRPCKIFIICDKNKDTYEIGFYGPGGGKNSSYRYIQKPINDETLCKQLKKYVDKNATNITALDDIFVIDTLLTSLHSWSNLLNSNKLNQLLQDHDGIIQCNDRIAYYDNGYVKKLHAIEPEKQAQLTAIMSQVEEDKLQIASDEQLKIIKAIVERPTNLIEKLDEIKAILLKGVGETPNNIECGYKALVRSQESIDSTKFITAFKEISALPNYDAQAVEAILKKHGFVLKTDIPEVFSRDSQSVKTAMIELLLVLETGKFGKLIPNESDPDVQARIARAAELNGLNNKELRLLLNEAWKKPGNTMTSYMAKFGLATTISQLKNAVIIEAFQSFDNSPFSEYLKKNIAKLSDFDGANDFEKIDEIFSKAESLAIEFSSIMSSDNFKSNQVKITESFTKFVNFSNYDYNSLYGFVALLNNMPYREDYSLILHQYFVYCNKVSDKTCRREFLEMIRDLHESNFPSSYIVKCMEYYAESKDYAEFGGFLRQIQGIFARDKDDVILKFVMEHKETVVSLCVKIIKLTQGIEQQRAAIAKLFGMMTTSKKPIFAAFIKTLASYPLENAQKLTEIIAACHASTLAANLTTTSVNYVNLAIRIHELNDNELNKLRDFLAKYKVSIPCLETCLKDRDPNIPFQEFLKQFEKSPFGIRDLSKQFDTAHIERVINSLQNLNNKTSNHYKYRYRKQMMEAFLFVNRAGLDLPVYRNKPAKELSNDEIRELFLELKSGKFTQFDLFQKRLYALGLMREAMYRATGQFPYSTQIIALLDCMMHEGDVIQNIDTGQGKSLVDTMKGVLLWLDSDSVVISSSSLVDAKRDLEIYTPFLSLLGVPHAKSPINSALPFGEYSTKGINYTTMAQAALFFSRAKGEEHDIGEATDVVSLVMNESDYTILDDRTIYRFAVTGGPGLLGEEHEWIYDSINQFVEKSEFRACMTSLKQDIESLKRFLLAQAKELKKSAKILHSFTDEKLLMWIESAIIVNYRLRENFDYVLTEKPEPKIINNVLRETRSAKILMKDGKISPDTQYGNGMQQLLYAKLNKKLGEASFVIEPESQTIISLNNKNMIDHYRSKNGYIWGSSGTVGGDVEIDTQYRKYGFEFSKVEPHQRKIVKMHNALIEDDETKQFKQIAKQLKSKKWFTKYQPPCLVFFKDINSANRFHEYLTKHHPKLPLQLFMGLGDEEKTIRDAAKPGMITITTPALGRNTDVPYDKSVGMKVIQTFIGSAREEMQRSGRTGRQGSKGDVHYILNKQDVKGKSKSEIQAQLDAKAEKERRFNEDLYNILGALLVYVGKADKPFFRVKWALFSENVETQYREERLNNSYKPEEFLQKVVNQFNQISEKKISIEQLKDFTAEDYVDYQPYTKPVKIKECIPADIIAYQFVNSTLTNEMPSYSKDEVKAKLEKLFSAVNKKNYAVVNNDYIAYLNTGQTSMAVIKEAHKEFLSDYLKRQVKLSSQVSFFKRWLGFEGQLNKITANQNYLLLFKAIVNIPENDIALDAIKASVVTLIQEYLKHSWFVSKPKKQAALRLIEDIQHTHTIPDLIVQLSKSKIDMIQDDQQRNKHGFWRKIKPVNYSGNSRYQNTLDRALSLIDSVAENKSYDKLLDDLSDEYKKTVKKPERISLFSEKKSVDIAKKQMESVEYKDKSNAKVIEKSIDSALKRNPGGSGKAKP